MSTTPVLRPSLRRDLVAGLIGGAIAATVNTAIFFVARGLAGPLLIQPPGASAPTPLLLLAVLLFSLVAGVAAGAVLRALRSTAHPVRWFLVVAVVVFALLFFAPFGAAAGAATVWTLELMHVVAAVAVVGSLLRPR